MADIRLTNVTKRFGDLAALDDLSFHVDDGEFFVILGHPGAGKTTTLRTIVGLERPDEGTVEIGGQDMVGIAPGDRGVGIVFQNLALYPDKTVYDNLAFPLRQRRTDKLDKAEVERRVRSAAETLRIMPLLDRKPAKLSGGERQRVAIGRVMTREPEVYLLDEPLSALDALLRMEMRVELKRLQQELGKTLVYVTHDQVEAMSMADRVAVLVDGHVEQIGVPTEIYDRPATVAVARTVGSPPMNLLPLTAAVDGGLVLRSASVAFAGAAGADFGGIASGDAVQLGIRPEDVVIGADDADHPFAAKVMAIEPLGAETIIDLHVDGTIVKASVPPNAGIAPDETVHWGVHTDRVHVFDEAGVARWTAAGSGDLSGVSVR